MPFNFNVNGQEYSIENIDEDNKNININVATDDKNKSSSSNGGSSKGCFGCLIQIVSCVLIIAGVTEGIKELKKDHIYDYCKWDGYFSSHQENQIRKEINKKTYYIHEKQTTDIMLASEYETIKNEISDDAIVEYIEGPSLIKIKTKKNKLPEGYDYVEDGYAYKTIDEDQVKVTANIRILSKKKKIDGFENRGEYTLNNSDEIFVFAKSFNQDGKAQDVKMVNLSDFDYYIDNGYNFIGVADNKTYDITLFKTQYSSINDIRNYNYSDSEIVESKSNDSQKVK